jgi:hypothetical protein
MQSEGRDESQRQLVKRITRITTYIVPDDDGVELRFINSSDGGSKLRADQVEAIMNRVRPDGATELGTNLVNKILRPMVYDKLPGKQLRRPLIVSVLTDGRPGGSHNSPERPDTFKKAIIECGQKLAKAGYEPEGESSSLITTTTSKSLLSRNLPLLTAYE